MHGPREIFRRPRRPAELRVRRRLREARPSSGELERGGWSQCLLSGKARAPRSGVCDIWTARAPPIATGGSLEADAETAGSGGGGSDIPGPGRGVLLPATDRRERLRGVGGDERFEHVPSSGAVKRGRDRRDVATSDQEAPRRHHSVALV